MIICDVEQGSDQWHQLRHGLISASRFKDVMTQPRSKADKEAGLFSQTSISYMDELIAEVLTGQAEQIKSHHLDWGNTYEPMAIAAYEFEKDVTVGTTGIIISDCGLYGGSPDGIVGAVGDGMNEIKCPSNPKNHVANIRRGMDKDHIPQVQGNMWINESEWCDFVSFDPRISGTGRIYIERIHRDQDYIDLMEERLKRFSDEMKTVLMSKFGIEWQGVTVEDFV